MTRNRSNKIELPVMDEEYKKRFNEEYFVKYFAGYPIDVYGRRAVSRAASIIELFRPESALDLGCAFGYLTSIMNDSGVDTFGVDISEYAINKALTLGNKSVLCRNAIEMKNFTSNQFDVVMAFDTLDRIPPGSLKDVIKEIVRVTSRFVVISVSLYKNDLLPNTVLLNGEPIPSRFSVKFWKQNFGDYGCYFDSMRYGKDENGEDIYYEGVLFFVKQQTPEMAYVTMRKEEAVRKAKMMGIEVDFDNLRKEEIVALIIAKNKDDSNGEM